MTAQTSDIHTGGCQCGQVRYRTTGQPAKSGVCHCRYCQVRTGSAFGVSVYFPTLAIDLLHGTLKSYRFQTESGRDFTTRFCPDCGTTLFWNLAMFPDQTGIAGGTFDPPSFWYDVTREIFTRTKAPFVRLCLQDSFETTPSYAPVQADPAALRGA